VRSRPRGLALGVITTSAAFGVYEWQASPSRALPAPTSVSSTALVVAAPTSTSSPPVESPADPHGTFQAEALPLEIDIAGAEGRKDDVRRLGERFLVAFSSSPHVARVRAALARP
jgi:hypothetical protein